MGKVREEEIQLNQRTPGMVVTDGVADVDSDIIVYQVPAKSQLEIRATDFLGLFLSADGATPVEITATSLITVLWTDAFARRTEILAQGEYTQFKAMTAALEKYFFKGKTKVIPANYRLIIRCLSDVVVYEGLTRFTLSVLNVYETIE
ncbi:hypothetical protein ES705_15214 [subsurface metagenome]